MGIHTQYFGRYFRQFVILAVGFLSSGTPTVVAQPIAAFSASQTTGCSPLSVQFSNASTGAVSYYWDLGNGNTSSLANPTNLYTLPGSYTIRLIVFDALGNTDTLVKTNFITVTGKPVSDFTAANTSSCLDNNSFSFTNNSTGAVSYLWDFGDGNTSGSVNPVHSYTLSGTFTVTLIATNAFGCQDIKIRNQYITIFPKPDAAIQANITNSCDPSTVFQFSNNGQNIVSWQWAFGDGGSSTQQNPSHAYSGPGTYFVNLMVTNNYGCRDTADQPEEIRVGVAGWADFSYSADTGCAPFQVNFTNTIANVASVSWDFGDGGTSTLPAPSHTYNNPGVYTVSMSVTTTTGCSDIVVKNNLIVVGAKPSVSLSYVNGSGCGPLTVQFINTSSNFVSCLWLFGDGSSSTQTNPAHTYTNSGTFSVTLKCWGPTGCTKSIVYRDIIAVTRTEAMFSATPRIGCPPLDVTFAAISPGSGLTYLWDFGDGTTSTSQNPQHTYNTSGNFDVTLIVTDSLGCRDTLVKQSYIRTVNPVANYIPPPTTSGCAPLTAQFTDATIGAVSWLWNFGDGTTSALQNPVHTYTTPGFYTVSLTTTTAGGGCTQTINTFSTFDVHGGYAGFTHTNTPCPPYEATFQDTSLNAVSWLWDFGDGTTSTLQNPSHTYTSPGYHSVSLTITTADGCTYTTMQSNSVYFPPFGANFFGLPLDTVFPMPVQFHANSVGATSWLWDFGDGTTSVLEDPFHIFQNPGNYNITLTISNGLCTLFYDPPPFNFGTPDSTPVDVGNPGIPEEQRGCGPLTVAFTQVYPGSVDWDWDFGDGETSGDQFPVHTYLDAGIYTVILTTTDSLGTIQVHRMDSIVKVYGPRAGFIVSQASNCNNSQVMFVDTSHNATSWYWDFGDGSNSTLQNPTHLYSGGLPNYIVTQTVSDTAGCSSSISRSIYSNFADPLLASETDICGEDTVHFFTSLQNFATYLWDFGDGTTSNLVNPAHLYSQEGVFHPTLTVTDLTGCTQTFAIDPPITVNIPVADFATTGRHTGCNHINVLFDNQSQNADTYLWEFGDGTTSSLENPLHPYMDPGVFDVTLTVFRGNCLSRISFPQYVRVDTAYADYSVAASGFCLPVTAAFSDLSVNPVSWQWFFGDGDSSSVQNPVHLYTQVPAEYPKLVMTDIHGCTDTIAKITFPLLHAGFETSQDTGCLPMSVTFNNTSGFASIFQWDFGDGSTSTDVSPTHVYNQAGVYDVTLIAGNTYTGCRDTLRIPALISVRKPIAGFMSPDLSACAPSLVHFTDQSVDGYQYLWDFGDSTTSTNSNPSHIYNEPGIYTVSLIVTSDAGCSDTLIRPEYIRVLGPNTHFTASAFEGCAPFTVDFTDQSNNAIQWNWSFGDGYAGVLQDPVHTFQDTGAFTVSLVTLDTTGCTSYYELPQRILVHPSPDAVFQVSNISGCQPFTTTFQNQSTGYTTAWWDFGDGDTSSQQNPAHTYLVDGNYPVRLMVSNSYGCSDTAFLQQPLQVEATPQPAFSPNATQGCPPFQVTFQDISTNLSGPSYYWDFGNGITSTDPNPQVTFTSPGFYTVSLQITNVSGCSAAVTFPALIQVLDTLPPNASKIYSVSVTSNSTVEIKWENNPAIDLGSYILYRWNPADQLFHAIYTETNIQNTVFTLESTHVDSGLNTLQNTYTYKLQALDICGNTIPLDQLTAHTTVNVSSQRSGENIQVSWTPYGGCPVNTYEIYRCEPGTQPQYLATVPSAQLNYLDSGFSCPYPWSYRIKATSLCGTSYYSLSDTSVTIPLNTLEGQVVDVVRSTVVDNQTILTEWKQPQVHPEKIAQFDIYRGTDEENYRYIATVPSIQTDYMDYNVDVQKNRYFYKIRVVNTCDVAEDLSPLTNSILLQGIMDEARQVHLEWSPYAGWDPGVEYYILEKQDENGHWQFLKRVDGTTLNYDYQE